MSGFHERSSRDIEWETPQDLFDYLNREFHFTLDPCATRANAKCAHFYTKEEDGLSRSWEGETVFMNPPYGREIGAWVKKASHEADGLVIGLVPVRTDSAWWHDYVMRAVEIRLIRGRLWCWNAEGKGGRGGYPSAVVVWRRQFSRLATPFVSTFKHPEGSEWGKR